METTFIREMKALNNLMIARNNCCVTPIVWYYFFQSENILVFNFTTSALLSYSLCWNTANIQILQKYLYTEGGQLC